MTTHCWGRGSAEEASFRHCQLRPLYCTAHAGAGEITCTTAGLRVSGVALARRSTKGQALLGGDEGDGGGFWRGGAMCAVGAESGTKMCYGVNTFPQ